MHTQREIKGKCDTGQWKTCLLEKFKSVDPGCKKIIILFSVIFPQQLIAEIISIFNKAQMLYLNVKNRNKFADLNIKN